MGDRLSDRPALGRARERAKPLSGGPSLASDLAARVATGPASQLRKRLSTERIVQTALRYVERHGLPGLSMRRLGDELGVEAMSLYRYFPSKVALLDGCVEAAVRAVAAPPDETRDWVSAVRAYARSIRRLAHAYPHVFPLLAWAGPDHRAVQPLTEQMLAVWRQAGLDEATARYAQCAVHGFAMGTATAEIGATFGPYGVCPEAPSPPDRSCEPGAAGAERAASARPSGPRDADAEFEFSLDVLIDGLRDRLWPRAS